LPFGYHEMPRNARHQIHLPEPADADVSHSDGMLLHTDAANSLKKFAIFETLVQYCGTIAVSIDPLLPETTNEHRRIQEHIRELITVRS
jgi:hypothetical protein